MNFPEMQIGSVGFVLPKKWPPVHAKVSPTVSEASGFPWDVLDRFFLVVLQGEFRIHSAPRRLTWVRILLNFGFKYVSSNLIRSPCSMEDPTGAPPEYQEVRKSFRESEGRHTIVPDMLTYRWWQFLCAV